MRGAGRRALLGAGAAALGLAAAGAGARARAQSSLGRPGTAPPSAAAATPASPLDDRVGYGLSRDVVVRWGDAVAAGAPAWRPGVVDAEAAAAQFGWDAKLAAVLAPPPATDAVPRCVLVIAHPTAPQDLLFEAGARGGPGPERTAAAIASHGASVLNLVLQDGLAPDRARWMVAQGGFQSRRLTGATACRIAGPAAGHPRLRTADDPEGLAARGLLAVAGGCVTPWGTVLLAEGNALGLFGDGALAAQEAALWGAAAAPPREQRWSADYPRFDPARTPNEPHRFGWVVELDALDPGEQPVKRTALGRGAHGGVLALAAADGRAVVYLSERRPGGFVYRYVSNGRIDRQDRETNAALLNDGVLSVAVRAGTRIAWKPLPVTGEAGLGLIERSRVALAEGASGFDRPAGFAHDARSGRVYLALAGAPGDAARPGRVLELIPPGAGDEPGAGARADHAAAEVTVADFLRTGEDLGEGAVFAAPDSLACDAAGRLWIATAQEAGHRLGADTIVTTDLAGPHRGLMQRRYLAPRDAAMGGLGFSPDGGTLFAGVRHPGAGPGARYETPTTRWPALDPALPPRSTVIALGGVAR